MSPSKKEIFKMIGKKVRHKKTGTIGTCTGMYHTRLNWVVVDWFQKGTAWPASYLANANNIEIVKE